MFQSYSTLLQQAASVAADGLSAAHQQLEKTAGQGLSQTFGQTLAQAAEAGGLLKPESHRTEYVRIPLEAAKRVEFYNNADLASLVSAHLRDKEKVLAENAALKQLLSERGLHPEGIAHALKAEDHVKAIQRTDDGVNRVLLLSAHTEIENLRSRIARMYETQQQAGPSGDSPETAEAVRQLVHRILTNVLAAHGEKAPPLPPALPPVAGVTAGPASQRHAGSGPATGGARGGLAVGDGSAEELAAATRQAAEARAAMDGMKERAQRAEAEARELKKQLSRAAGGGGVAGGAELAAMEARAIAAERRAAEQGALSREIAEAAEELNRALEGERGKRAELEERTQIVERGAKERCERLEARLNRAKAEAAELGREREDLTRRLKAAAEQSSGDKALRDLAAKAEADRALFEQRALKAERDAARLDGKLQAAHAAAREAVARGDALSRTVAELRADLASATARVEARAAEAWSLRSELAALQEGQALQQRDSAERYEARLREAEEARAELTSALLAAERAAADGVASAVDRERLLGEVDDLREQLQGAQVKKELLRELAAALDRSEAAVAQTAQHVAVLEKQLVAARAEAEEARAAAAAARVEAAEALTGQADELTSARTALESTDPKDWPLAAQAALAVQAEALEAAERAVEEFSKRSSSAAADAERSAEAAEAAAAAAEARRRADMQSFARRCSALESDITIKDEVIRLHVADIAALEARLRELEKDAALWNAHRAERLEGVDLLYLKNVMIKYVLSRGRVVRGVVNRGVARLLRPSTPSGAATWEQSQDAAALLPVLATLLQFTPEEFRYCSAAALESEAEAAAGGGGASSGTATRGVSTGGSGSGVAAAAAAAAARGGFGGTATTSAAAAAFTTAGGASSWFGALASPERGGASQSAGGAAGGAGSGGSSWLLNPLSFVIGDSSSSAGGGGGASAVR